jgi:FtsP/CotA-like multicopper oxidase with cupredoxin domain
VERSQRIGLLVAAVVVAVVAVILLSGGDDDDSSSSDSTAQTSTTGGGMTTTEQPSAPAVTTITIKAGEPVGGVREIEADKGDAVEFTVKSDADHEIHLHGYDIAKEVEAGGQVSYKFAADIDGIFEVEIEDLKKEIAELRVNP